MTEGVNFTSALVEELYSAFGIQKCRTTAYHAQCNGQVEHFHQTLFYMIGKLSCDKKAQWEQHLLELLQAYNRTQSAVTSYLLHYLMFGRHPRLPVDYYVLMVSAYKRSHRMPAYVTEVQRRFKEAYTRGSPPDKLRGRETETLLSLSHKYCAISTRRHCTDEK